MRVTVRSGITRQAGLYSGASARSHQGDRWVLSSYPCVIKSQVVWADLQLEMTLKELTARGDFPATLPRARK